MPERSEGTGLRWRVELRRRLLAVLSRAQDDNADPDRRGTRFIASGVTCSTTGPDAMMNIKKLSEGL